MNCEELESLVHSAQKYDYIRFTCSDICGGARGVTVPRRNAARFIRDGIGIYSGAISFGPTSEIVTALETANLCNVMLSPESKTAHPVPWAGHGKYTVGEVICETRWLNGNYQEAGPRTVARRQLEKLQEQGLAIKSAFEMEFMLENAETGTIMNPLSVLFSFIGPGLLKVFLKQHVMNISGEPVWEGTDAFSHRLVSKQEEILFQIDQQLLKAGVSVEKIQSEYSAGQYEMSLNPEFDIKAADDMFMFKHGVKEIAAQKGLLANFMAKPRFKHLGNGAHYNHSLWTVDLQQSVFFDATKENKFSDITGWWLGGLCKHAPALSALYCPTVNCYRRLHTKYAPDRANWGMESRVASFRAKNISASGCLVENRIPSGNCNPYLVLAGVVTAGLDGIVNKIPCPDENDMKAPLLPATLKEAVDLLKNDTAIIEALGAEFVHYFVESKNEIDIKKLEMSDPSVNDPEMLAAECKLYSVNI